MVDYVTVARLKPDHNLQALEDIPGRGGMACEDPGGKTGRHF
jgi:hypothetical protein